MARDKDTVARELLAVRCRRGDRAALEELVRTFEGRLFYFVRRLVRDEADARDVLQKTWMRVLTGVGQLDDPARLVPWLYRIARNTALSYAQHREPPTELFVEVPDPGATDPADFGNAEQVHHGLQKLTLPHREVLTLFFLEDMSVEDIAEVLSVPQGTVKSRLFHAKRTLRKVLDT